MDHTTEMILREAICEIRDEIVAAIRPRELTRAEEVERLAERLFIASASAPDAIALCHGDSVPSQWPFVWAEEFFDARDRRRAEREGEA